ncbi:anosmin-1-like [Acropora muricata]|uniref:anosmin-1-like n=1 Tax=Acropora muricata TaxID=159855 RepID=UPI0034E43BC8
MGLPTDHLLLAALIGNLVFQTSASLVNSARCRSRCIAKEIQNHNVSVQCGSSSQCLACMQPCNESKILKGLPCLSICRIKFGKFPQLEKVCQESCKFIKHLHLKDGNNNSSSCPPQLEVPRNNCVLMSPTNVEVSVPKKNSKIEHYQLRWNGTWPLGTVFVIMSRQIKTRRLSANDTAVWIDMKQTTSLSVQLDVQPLWWQQFRVAAVNQYGTSSFSAPSKFVFINPLSPGPPRNLRVADMRIVKSHINVDISWKKPVDSNLRLPVDLYKLSWSNRYDEHQGKFLNIIVTDRRVKGNVHMYTIKELFPNTTYVIEIRAIGKHGRKRFRSPWVKLRIRTLALQEVVPKKKPKKPIKKVNVNIKGNTHWKKPKPTKRRVLSNTNTLPQTEITPTSDSINLHLDASTSQGLKTTASTFLYGCVLLSLAIFVYNHA